MMKEAGHGDSRVRRGGERLDGGRGHENETCLLIPLKFADERVQLPQGLSSPGEFLDWITSLRFINELTGSAREFFKHDRVEMPGLLQLDFGFLNVRGRRMRDNPVMGGNARLGESFPNEVYRSTWTVNAEPFVRIDEPEVQQLFQDIKFGF